MSVGASFVPLFCLVICLFMCLSSSLSSEFEPGGKPEVKIINSGADVTLGAVVNVRGHGSGLFGCGDRRLDGVATVDALTWAVHELNHKLWSGSSANVSIGLRIMDSCSRSRIAASQLADFLPDLNGGSHPSPETEVRTYRLAVLDAVGLEGEEDVSRALEEMNMPVVSTVVQVQSPQDVMHTAVAMVDELRWDHVAVVHSSSLYSTAMLRFLTKALKKVDLCIPWIVNLSGDDDLAKPLASGIPILALLPSEEQHLLLRRNLSSPYHNTPILFTDLVLRDTLKWVRPGQVKLYAMTVLPEKEMRFEEFHIQHSIVTGVRMEDELQQAQRTRLVRGVEHVMKRISRALGRTLREVCPEGKSLCSDLNTPEGRSTLEEFLDEKEYLPSSAFTLVQYQYQFPDVHVHLHKIISYTNHKRLEVFEPALPTAPPGPSCDEDGTLPHCRCLEMKALRSESARNMEHFDSKTHPVAKEGTETEYIYYSAPDVRPVDHASEQPSAYTALRDPLNAALASLTLLGALVTLFTGQYFATSAALPHGGLTSGTSILGYLILMGLFALFSSNLSFVLTPSVATCAVRRFLPNFCYAVVFSGMMVKVWASWRQTQSEKAQTWKPSSLLLLSLSFTVLQVVLSGTWLLLVTPRVHYDGDVWSCYPSGDLDSHLLLSMIYVVGLLFTTSVLAIRTCAQSNNSESRWILTSAALTAIVFSCWGVAVATGVWPGYRSPATNLVSATILLLCMYVPKIRLHAKLKRSQPELATYPSLDVDKEYTVYAARPAFPIMMDYAVAPSASTESTESGFTNQAYSVDGGTITESMSIPFEIETSSFSEPEHENFTFSTFLEDPQPLVVHDPTQEVPSSLYPLEMFSKDDEDDGVTEAEHCEPGTNEFTPPHRTSSQMYLCPAPDWVP